jgi:hypothetical protein
MRCSSAAASLAVLPPAKLFNSDALPPPLKLTRGVLAAPTSSAGYLEFDVAISAAWCPCLQPKLCHGDAYHHLTSHHLSPCKWDRVPGLLAKMKGTRFRLCGFVEMLTWKRAELSCHEGNL